MTNKYHSVTNVKLERYDPRYNVIAELCCSKIEDILDDLKVDVTFSGNKYIGVCPIHGDSDNPNALNIYKEGYSVPGFWRCRTKGCESKRNKQGKLVFGKTILGFIRGRLSNLKLNYHHQKRPNFIYPFGDTLSYISNFLNIDINNIKIDEKEIERKRFIAECIQAENNSLQTYNGDKIGRKKVRNSLIIPSEYFLNRGYSKKILDEYDVGLAKKPKEETKNRVIIPIYNQEEFLTGYTCRSIFEKCQSCKLYHNAEDACPAKHEANLYPKWRHVNFNAEDQLYNYWKAYQYIKSTNVVLIVEGPGDVWRLEENGIHNSVAIFGRQLHDGQERLLAKAQAMTIIILLDNDEAGRAGCIDIKEKFGRLYRMYFPNIIGKDIGDLNEDLITENIKPYIESTKYL